MADAPTAGPDLAALVDNINVGIVVVNREHEVVLWNRFMAVHSGRSADEVVGRNLFEAFPELPKRMLRQKVRSVFLLNHQAFTSWEHRPYIFAFPHNRPITGGVDRMRQDCTFFPIADDSGEPAFVALTIFDMTDASIYQERMQQTQRELEELSARDRLTWLYNRGYFEQELERAFNQHRDEGTPLSLLLLDIDHFKDINDRLGHDTGDSVLKHLARCVRGIFRGLDVPGRYGGEEFAVYLPGTDLDGAQQAVERLRAQVGNRPARHHEMEVPFTISVGVTEMTERAGSPEALMKEADLALYAAKNRGRDQMVVYTPDMGA